MGAHFVPETGEFRNLMARVRAQDPEAARELVRCYESAIRRVIRIQMRDTRLRQILDSTDVCQSVLATFFVRTALGQYELESPAQLVGLLTTIARNKLVNRVDHMRAQRRDVVEIRARIHRESPCWIAHRTPANRHLPARFSRRSCID